MEQSSLPKLPPDWRVASRGVDVIEYVNRRTYAGMIVEDGCVTISSGSEAGGITLADAVALIAHASAYFNPHT